MISAEIRKEILHRLKATEKEHNVRILLAIESGSRAWGFESPNSDYDVRFIYAHSKDWYIAVDLEDRRDVIEYKIVDDIDLNGWDIRKALKLFSKSNPAFIEWIQSPIVYIEEGCFAKAARAMLASIYSCKKGVYHYRSMAKTNYRGYLKTEMVPLKKYFYVLRPLLAIRWLEKYAEVAPIEFEKLLNMVSGNKPLVSDICLLLERKKRSLEKDLSLPVKSLNKFIESELRRLEVINLGEPVRENEMIRLNHLFHRVLDEGLSS
ncbi:MAG TPA: nucleotidyltransferase domain-containing protein [Gammaproteobacteria bacterium]|nr:nucleotidyltransferase domain-containing protein [Gammaproteobacteria bacterium]